MKILRDFLSLIMFALVTVFIISIFWIELVVAAHIYPDPATMPNSWAILLLLSFVGMFAFTWKFSQMWFPKKNN